MKYIVHKRFKGKTVSGEVNLPAMTPCECDGVVITYEGKVICAAKSYAAFQHFTINEDGMGMVRGRLTRAIQNALAKRDDNYQQRWDKVWEDPVCQPYKRTDHEDHWLWNQDFFNADVDVLRHIAQLVDAKEDA